LSHLYLQLSHAHYASVVAVVTIATSGTMERSVILQLTGYYWLLKIALLCSAFTIITIPTAIAAATADVAADASPARGGGDGNDDAVNIRL